MNPVQSKTEEELLIMREAGGKLFNVMEALEEKVQPGANTFDLDKLAEELVLAKGGVPAFKGYGAKSNPFPATICASLNNEVVHGIPRQETILAEGDILKVDIGMKYKGYFVDMARTFAVGKISHDAQSLIAVAEQCFWEGVGKMKEGAMLSDYSKAVEEYVSEAGYSVVRNLVGHGIGKNLHEDPQVANFYDASMADFELQAGMTFALEPMINQGTHKTKIGRDGWVFETADGKLSAHYENTIVITESGVEVLTMS